MRGSSYSKGGAFPVYLSQTNGKKVEIKYILPALREKYDFSGYAEKDFVFTDIGAGEGTVTLPVIKFLKKKARLEAYMIEPSSMMETLKAKCGGTRGANLHFIRESAENSGIPFSDFILLSHSASYIKEKKEFAKRLSDSLARGGKILFVGTAKESEDLKLRKELNKESSGKNWKEKPRENIFEYLEKGGLKVKREKRDAWIDFSNAFRLNDAGKGLISFFLGKPFPELSKSEVENFLSAAKRLVKKNRLKKVLEFTWAER